MLKKMILLALAAMLLLAQPLGAGAEVVEDNAYYAVAYWRPDEVAALGLSQEEASRTAYATLFGYGPLQPLLLPEGSDIQPDESCEYIGVRLTFDEPLAMEREGNNVLSIHAPEGTLKPTKAERIGTVSYGPIQAIDDASVTQEVWYDTDNNPNEEEGLTATYALSPDTLTCIPSPPFVAGNGCEMIIGEDGVVLTMTAANG